MCFVLRDGTLHFLSLPTCINSPVLGSQTLRTTIMSGKRILDALSLLSVTRTIVRRHFDIRLSQAQLYAQSSSLLKTARRQGLPILANAVSRFASSTRRQSSQSRKEGIKQDHFYTASDANSTADAAPEAELDIAQVKAERSPLPDGTIPPSDSPIGAETGDGITYSKVPAGETPQHPVDTKGGFEGLQFAASTRQNLPGSDITTRLSSEHARKAQRQSEDQIPARTAEPPSADDTAPEFGVEQEQDVFYQPPDSVRPVLSALPRVRVPKTENDVQEGDAHIEPGLNADVYYHGSKREVDADEPTEEQLAQIFHNPRHAKMYAQKARYAPGGVGPGAHPASSRRFHTVSVRGQKPSADAQSLKQLGADLAKDVQQNTVSSPSYSR
jgi:aarF domain-containing kinase